MGTGSERKRARSRGYGDGRYTRRHARDTGAAGRRRHAAKGEGWKRGGHVNKTIRSNGQRNAKSDTGNRSYTDAQRIRNNSRELPHTHKRIRNTTISVHVNTGHSSDSTHVRHSTGPLSAQEEEATQHMKRATPCGMEYWPTLGIATAQKQQPATFAAWIQRGKHADPETHRSRARAQGLMKEWHMDRVMTKNQQTVVCIARAERRVAEWRRLGKGNGRRIPPVRLVAQLQHTAVLPTAVANKADRYYLPQEGRHVNAAEMARAFGVTGPLRATLVHKRAQIQTSETQVISMLGAAMHVPTASRILGEAMRRAGIADGGTVTLCDVCSGVGTAAAAMEHATQGRYRYVAAAEWSTAQRRILKAAWAHRGICEANLRRDAYGDDDVTTARADVYVMTPECGRWSQEGSATMADAMQETKRVETLMRYAKRVRPGVVMLESVPDLLGSGRMRACGVEIERILSTALPDYEWRAQVVDAMAHGGVPMSRRRAFWVGTKRWDRPVP